MVCSVAYTHTDTVDFTRLAASTPTKPFKNTDHGGVCISVDAAFCAATPGHPEDLIQYRLNGAKKLLCLISLS